MKVRLNLTNYSCHQNNIQLVQIPDYGTQLYGTQLTGTGRLGGVVSGTGRLGGVVLTGISYFGTASCLGLKPVTS